MYNGSRSTVERKKKKSRVNAPGVFFWDTQVGLEFEERVAIFSSNFYVRKLLKDAT
jgi:hypothetical protein